HHRSRLPRPHRPLAARRRPHLHRRPLHLDRHPRIRHPQAHPPRARLGQTPSPRPQPAPAQPVLPPRPRLLRRSPRPPVHRPHHPPHRPPGGPRSMSDRIPLDHLTSDQLDHLYERAEQAEAALTRVQHVAALIHAAAPWTANRTDTAARIRAAIAGPGTATAEETVPRALFDENARRSEEHTSELQ